MESNILSQSQVLLIAQFGRNFDKNSISIKGRALMDIVLNQAKMILSFSSGKTIFLECEKKQKLLDFYNLLRIKTQLSVCAISF